MVVAGEEELDAGLVANVDLFRLAEFDHPASEDVLGSCVVFWSSLGDVNLRSEKEEFDRQFITVFVEEFLVRVVSLLGKFGFPKAAVEDDLQEGGDGAVGRNVRTQASHFSVGLAEEVAGCCCFGIADRADCVEEAVENGGTELQVLPGEGRLGIGIDAFPGFVVLVGLLNEILGVEESVD